MKTINPQTIQALAELVREGVITQEQFSQTLQQLADQLYFSA